MNHPSQRRPYAKTNDRAGQRAGNADRWRGRRNEAAAMPMMGIIPPCLRRGGGCERPGANKADQEINRKARMMPPAFDGMGLVGMLWDGVSIRHDTVFHARTRVSNEMSATQI